MVEIGSWRGTQKNIAGRNIKREIEEGLFFTFVYNINISYLNCFWNSNWTSKGCCSDTLYTTSSDSVSWPAAKSTNLILVQEVTRFKILQFVTQNSLKYPLTATTRFFLPRGKKNRSDLFATAHGCDLTDRQAQRCQKQSKSGEICGAGKQLRSSRRRRCTSFPDGAPWCLVIVAGRFREHV